MSLGGTSGVGGSGHVAGFVIGAGAAYLATEQSAQIDRWDQSAQIDRWAGPLSSVEDYAAFYVDERSVVLRFIRGHPSARGWDDSTIHDVAHEAWAAVYNKLGRIDSARAYLYRTLRNKITDEVRHRARTAPADDLEAILDAAGASADDPLDLVAAREMALTDLHPAACEVLAALWQLPERQREAYRLRVAEHLTSAGIAERLGCTADAVNNLVNRARCALLERFGRERVTWFEAGEWGWPE
jgi:RNA polymerase sigma factor (sigma-70 family)